MVKPRLIALYKGRVTFASCQHLVLQIKLSKPFPMILELPTNASYEALDRLISLASRTDEPINWGPTGGSWGPLVFHFSCLGPHPGAVDQQPRALETPSAMEHAHTTPAFPEPALRSEFTAPTRHRPPGYKE